MSLDALTARPPAGEPPLLRATVIRAPATAGASLYVELDGLPGPSLGPCRFSPKGAELPAVGDTVLIGHDDQGDPWALEWGPAAGLEPVLPWSAGDIKLTARAAAEAGWLECDGGLELRADYPALFAAIGTAYNTGGETGAQFRKPDLRSRVPVGAGDGGAGLTDRARGSIGGAETVALSTAELASHSHGDGTLAAASHSHDDGTLAAASHSHGDGTLAADSHSHGDGTLAAASGGDHDHGGATAGFWAVNTGVLASGYANTIYANAPYWGSQAAAIVTAGIGASGTHTHDVTGSTGSAGPDVTGSTGSAGADVTGSTGSAGADVTGSTGSAGSGTAHENMPPYAVVRYVIKA